MNASHTLTIDCLPDSFSYSHPCLQASRNQAWHLRQAEEKVADDTRRTTSLQWITSQREAGNVWMRMRLRRWEKTLRSLGIIIHSVLKWMNRQSRASKEVLCSRDQCIGRDDSDSEMERSHGVDETEDEQRSSSPISDNGHGRKAVEVETELSHFGGANSPEARGAEAEGDVDVDMSSTPRTPTRKLTPIVQSSPPPPTLAPLDLFSLNEGPAGRHQLPKWVL
ncbi:hypothetical protein D9613_003586 [Agrocybe pediades]|uniref:Uncharacterized protein n=1 Tax=Agrocybe pediades TaxID=84607 RepID=A0A8H4QK99_9AGAR|nr:hypothetical protein D9613_003586 [Agrocybe pediades]